MRIVLVILVATGLPVGIAGCGRSTEPAPVITVVITSAATKTPTTQTSEVVLPTARVVTSTTTDTPAVKPTSTLRSRAATSTHSLERDTSGTIGFEIPDDVRWEKIADNAYSVSGDEDTFAWSKQMFRGDLEFSADVESDFAGYGEAMVLIYGDGKGWSPGSLIFNITGYWQAIRAHSVYDPEVEWLVQNERHLDFANRSRYRMTIRVTADSASLFVDDELVASTPMLPRYNREGYVALV
jgi:hypothetical protein